MMGRFKQDQGQLFFSFNLDEAVPDDHLVRKIAAVLDDELASHYSAIGRPLDRSGCSLLVRCSPSAQNVRFAVRCRST
jgi:hypothetical protein